ncbi:MAG: AAA family ATPase, partial [Myxococcaceae bacterium]|nr:AAA family ATPase [Myxococcaceae bacterium]
MFDPKSPGDRASTGIPGLDDVLAGGLPRNRTYLIQGDPGVGKTTMGLQFLLAGVARGESGLYVSLSETKTEIDAVAESHGWSLDGLHVHELSAAEQLLHIDADNSVFHPSEVELRELTRMLIDVLDKTKPRRVVFDSLSEIRLLSQNAVEYRRQILRLKHHYANRDVTVLLLDDRSNPDGDKQLQSIAHGVISLEQMPQSYGTERRRIRVTKLRGLKFRGGFHDYRVDTGGLVVYPRLIAAEHQIIETRPKLQSGVEGLDRLVGGGLDPGTSTLFLGPAGSGKSSVMLQYAVSAAAKGKQVSVFAFDEGKATMMTRAKALGIPLGQHVASGAITVRQVDPAELAPDELAHEVRRAVEKSGTEVVAIDSLNGYLNAMPDERFLAIQLHELLSYLSHKGVVTLLVMAQHSFQGAGVSSPVDLSYVADGIVLLRFFEHGGRLRKAISMVKKRSGAHENA